MLTHFHLGRWSTTTMLSSPPILQCSPKASSCGSRPRTHSAFKALNAFKPRRVLSFHCNVRRRSVRYDDEDEGEDEGYDHNKEIAMLELYSQSVRGEALIVHAMVDDQQVEVLIFKGFSSCLSYRTSPDPSKSILPARAVIKCIDRIKGPFDPSNIEYLQKGLTWEAFKSSLPPNLRVFIE